MDEPGMLDAKPVTEDEERTMVFTPTKMPKEGTLRDLKGSLAVMNYAEEAAK